MGILAAPRRTRRSSSATRSQCRSLLPGAFSLCQADRVSVLSAAGRHIPPADRLVCTTPPQERRVSASNGLPPLRSPPCSP
ncbi:hypothetical protein NDU88_007413 [Pleurodeles waltl]|uniref:Uncharacterized protein n=1 Tax=Pleurodeles waltl TaxID=8319 RepID=A0AAV7UQK6_PLEWA|nr:hypothetical protein NDU88_007413 [Pleurodeles waltl]